MNRLCILCGEEINPKRVEILPNVQTCVKCSQTGPKKGVTVSLGEGDHNFNDLVILGEDEYKKYSNLLKNRVYDEEYLLEALDLDKDEKTISIKDTDEDKVLTPEIDEPYEEYDKDGNPVEGGE